MFSTHQSGVPVRQHSLENASQWALLATLFIGAFLVVPSSFGFSITAKTFALGAGALVTLALFVLARLSRGNIILPPFLLVGALWLPALAYGLSAAFSGVPFASALWGNALETDTFGAMLIVASLGTLAALILRRPEHFRSFLYAAAAIFSLVALAQALALIIGQFAPNLVSPAASFLGTYQDLALLLGLGVIGSLITMRFMTLPARRKHLLLGAMVLALIVLAVANSALVWTLVALVSLGLFVEAVMQRRAASGDSDLEDVVVMEDSAPEEDGGRKMLALPLAVLAVSLFFLLGSTLANALAAALDVNVLNVRPSWQSTLTIAQNALGSAPVFGTGPGTFGSQWLKYRDATLNSTVFWNLDLAAGIGFIPTSIVTTGLVGIVAWLLLLAGLLFVGVRTLIMRAPQDEFVRFVSILSFVGALYLFIVAVFGLPSAYLLALAFVFAGVFASTTRYAGEGSQWGVSFARSPRLGFLIVFSLTILLLASVAAAYSLAGRYAAAVGYARAATALGAGDLDSADKAISTAISFAPGSSAYQLSGAISNARLSQIAADSNMPPAEAQKAFQTALSNGITAALTATRLDPSNYQNWVVLGNLYAQAVPLQVAGAFDSAEAAYRRAVELNPTNPQIRLVLAQVNVANRDIDGAKEELREAIALKQDYTAAIFLLSQLEVQSGNIREALDAAIAASYFMPGDPNVLFQVGILKAASGDLPGAAEAIGAAVSANPQFANARYVLAAIYAKQGNRAEAVTQLQAIAAISEENRVAVESQIKDLEAGKNPFPANLLSVSTPQ